MVERVRMLSGAVAAKQNSLFLILMRSRKVIHKINAETYADASAPLSHRSPHHLSSALLDCCGRGMQFPAARFLA